MTRCYPRTRTGTSTSWSSNYKNCHQPPPPLRLTPFLLPSVSSLPLQSLQSVALEPLLPYSSNPKQHLLKSPTFLHPTANMVKAGLSTPPTPPHAYSVAVSARAILLKSTPRLTRLNLRSCCWCFWWHWPGTCLCQYTLEE